MFNCLKRLFSKPEPKLSDLPNKEMKNYPKIYLEAALRITGAFEGHGFSTVAGNFDGQGISAGVLQWNYGQGSLQNKILKPYIFKFGASHLDKYFPMPIHQTATMSPREAISFAKKNMLDSRGKVKPEWSMSWKYFLTSKWAREIQNLASDSVASKAWEYCEEHEMKSIKAFCWFFDIINQNGSLKGIEKPESNPFNRAEFYSYITDKDIDESNGYIWPLIPTGELDDESRLLFVWTMKRVTRNKWASDVISRKGTIAFGRGYVHGNFYRTSDIFDKYQI